MNNHFGNILDQIDEQIGALMRARAALVEVFGPETMEVDGHVLGPTADQLPKKAMGKAKRKRRGPTEEGKRRIAEAQRARWAELKKKKGAKSARGTKAAAAGE